MNIKEALETINKALAASASRRLSHGERDDLYCARDAVGELIERESVMRAALRRIANGEHREGATDGQIVGQMMQTAETALARVGGAL